MPLKCDEFEIQMQEDLPNSHTLERSVVCFCLLGSSFIFYCKIPQQEINEADPGFHTCCMSTWKNSENPFRDEVPPRKSM